MYDNISLQQHYHHAKKHTEKAQTGMGKRIQYKKGRTIETKVFQNVRDPQSVGDLICHTNLGGTQAFDAKNDGPFGRMSDSYSSDSLFIYFPDRQYNYIKTQQLAKKNSMLKIRGNELRTTVLQWENFSSVLTE